MTTLTSATLHVDLQFQEPCAWLSVGMAPDFPGHGAAAAAAGAATAAPCSRAVLTYRRCRRRLHDVGRSPALAFARSV